MSIALVGRQPICDRKLETYAYELLYRSSATLTAGEFDGDKATAAVALNMIFQIGLDNLVGPHNAFLNMTRSFLVEQHYRALPADRVVLEILEDIKPDAEVIEAIREASALGYRIALDDFIYGEQNAPLIEFADIIKVEIPALDRDAIADHVKLLKRPDIMLVAEKVETYEDFEYCRDAGYDLFQGYFFCKPKVIQQKRVPTDRLALLRLTATLHDPETDIQEIEQVIERNVSLSFMLLRIVNSSFHAHSYRIESIHHAVVLLGFELIQRCVSLLLMASIEDKPRELMITGLVRARFCDLLARHAPGKLPARYFTTGLLSVVDALMDMPMDDVLATIPLVPELKDALSRHEGDLGQAIEVVQACERSDTEALAGFGLDAESVLEDYFDALTWAFDVQKELAGFYCPTR